MWKKNEANDSSDRPSAPAPPATAPAAPRMARIGGSLSIKGDLYGEEDLFIKVQGISISDAGDQITDLPLRACTIGEAPHLHFLEFVFKNFLVLKKIVIKLGKDLLGLDKF